LSQCESCVNKKYENLNLLLKLRKLYAFTLVVTLPY